MSAFFNLYLIYYPHEIITGKIVFVVICASLIFLGLMIWLKDSMFGFVLGMTLILSFSKETKILFAIYTCGAILLLFAIIISIINLLHVINEYKKNFNES